ncbi:MAG: NAD(P)/FAD-dependent oxidoreductase [Flavobacterium sp.]|nr:NAD(P)/FAD-dependent oxidoreductase [Flavobacterium sp.]
MEKVDVIIIGGGLAGLTAAIHLSKGGLSVILIEKNSYPKHKVCGEYISNEVLPYLESLGLNIDSLQPTTITHLEFSTSKGNTIRAELPMGGFGISRYALDNYLYENAIENGCTIVNSNVENITFDKDTFSIFTDKNVTFLSRITLGAYGKRSNIDYKLDRNFIKKKSPWLAVKAHYSGSFPNHLVGLHNFEGGYCGVSKVENNVINICWLGDYQTFSQYKNIDAYQKTVLYKNPKLKAIFENANLLFEKPLTISQISFSKKNSIENHVLMIGDTAGLIHPLCGNGMAMAIHSAKIASNLVINYCNGIISRTNLEKEYHSQWHFHFHKRLKTGRQLSAMLQKKQFTEVLLRLFVLLPFLLPLLIKRTHGKPITLQHAS